MYFLSVGLDHICVIENNLFKLIVFYLTLVWSPGPLLFLIYVNDMSISVDTDCKLVLYVDDNAILFAHKDPHVISQKLGSVLKQCSEWLVDNKLSFHSTVTTESCLN